MDFERFLNDCDRLENNVTFMLEHNAQKRAELVEIQDKILEESELNSNELVNYGHHLLNQLNSIKKSKNKLDIELEQYTEVNEKLNVIVATSQKTHNEKKGVRFDYCEVYLFISDNINQFNNLRSEFLKIFEEISLLKFGLEEDSKSVKEILKDNKDLNVALQRNDDLLRLMEQQNRHLEQQFDLILNQLPWEPLSDRYLEEILHSTDDNVRNLAEVLKIQTNEVKELNTSLDLKKHRKLEILDQLKNQLDSFVRIREEAILMNNDYKSVNQSVLS